MKYNCPKCGGPVSRGHSTTAQASAGLVGALFYAAFGAFNCKECGKIYRSEFPPEVRKKMAMGTLGLIISAILIAIVVIFILANLD